MYILTIAMTKHILFKIINTCLILNGIHIIIINNNNNINNNTMTPERGSANVCSKYGRTGETLEPQLNTL